MKSFALPSARDLVCAGFAGPLGAPHEGVSGGYTQ